MSLFSPRTSAALVFTNDRIRVKQAAALAGVSPGTIYVWMAEGRFKTWTVRRRGFARGIRFIDKVTFDDFLKSQRQT
jgi:hypothetical protein